MLANFDLPLAPLQALALLTAQDVLRPYFGAVLCEVRPQSVVMVATNGHLLGAVLSHRSEPGANLLTRTMARAEEWLIPAELLSRIPKNAPGYRCSITVNGDPAPFADCDATATEQPAVLRVDDTAIDFRTMTGRFPDWRRVANIRERTPGAAAQFDPEYISLFSKFAAVFTGAKKRKVPRVLIGHNGPDKPAVITIMGFDNFTGLLMPMRTETADIGYYCPEWAIDSQWRDPIASAIDDSKVATMAEHKVAA